MNSATNQLTLGTDRTENHASLRIAILASPGDPLALRLLNQLNGIQPQWHAGLHDEFGPPLNPPRESEDSICICVPPLMRDGMTPSLSEAKSLMDCVAGRRYSHYILLSSALIYGTAPGRPGMVTEEYMPPGGNGNRIAAHWNSLETIAREKLGQDALLTVLRPAIAPGWPVALSRMLSRRITLSLPGHDPSLQFLSLDDLTAAMVCAIQAKSGGVFNVAPDGAVPLHQAIRLNGGRRLPVPRTLRRIFRPSQTLDFLRYSWTISNAKIKSELGFAGGSREVHAGSAPQFDDFGMDKDYIHFYGRTLFKFLSEYYWRIEDKGMENIPRQGRGLLVGMHRGFMPFDGVMALHTIVRKTGRYPRFLTHPGLLKFPFLANFMIKLGGVAACQESAEQVLERNELVGIFPEGIQGAFTYYRDAHKLQAFGRDAFVKLALRHRAPIIPFVTVGSAEIYPIFGKIKSRWWTRYTEWPCIPITPTFPVLPAPLPSKWHTQILAPVPVDQYPPEAAEDRAVVKAISRDVRARMQQAVDEMVALRRSIFSGSIFDRRSDEGQGKPVAV